MNKENIIATDTFQENRADFAITKTLDIHFSFPDAVFFADLSGKGQRAGTGENFD